MKSKLIFINCIHLLLISFLLTQFSYAQGDSNGENDFLKNFYIGGSYGEAEQKDVCNADRVLDTCDDEDDAWKIFIGYQFNKYISLEGGYVDFGESESTYTFAGLPNNFAHAEIDGFYSNALFSFPVHEKVSIFGKFGILFWDIELTDGINNGLEIVEFETDDDGTDYFFGAGIQAKITKHISARAEYEFYKDVGDSSIGKTDIEMYSASLIFHF